MTRVALAAATAADIPAARQLAEHLNLPFAATDPVAAVDFDLLLIVAGSELALCETGPRSPGPVLVDFGAGTMRHRRRGGQNELLGRAVGVGRKAGLVVLDATAGLGRDAFVLADLGCQVQMWERSPIVAALLESGLNRARNSGDPWLSAVAGHLSLCTGDARTAVFDPANPVDVIYLDPMFPPRGKSAAVKKDMAIFQRLLETPQNTAEGGDDTLLEAEGAALLNWALQQAVARVVVKRPPRAPLLGGRQPSHQLRSKALRFDVYVLRGLGQPSPDSD